MTAAQSETNYSELPNYQVNEKLCREAQPYRSGIRELKRLGIKTVINLRNDNERPRAEKAGDEKIGLRYFNVPLSNFGRPSGEKVRHVLALINAPENQPVFVHCKRGAPIVPVR